MIRHPIAILALLTGLNLLNYMDRFVVSAVLPKLQKDLDLSNFVGGLLATIFLVGYFVTSPLFGALGDRGKRTGLIALGVALWSIATVASGFATGAVSLLVCRALVGVGEASYATLAPTIIDDIAPEENKGKYLAVFYVATPLGSALGYLVGGAVEHHYNSWRASFFVAGGPGIVLALLCLLIAEPARKAVAAAKPSMVASMGTLLRIPQYRRGLLGYSAYTFAIGAFAYWAPKFLFEVYAMKLEKANFVFGVVTVLGGLAGTVIGGIWADRRKKAALGNEKREVNALLLVCAVGSAIGAPLAAAAFLSPSPKLFFVFAGTAEVALFLSTSPINAVALKSVPPGLRASAMALLIFAIHILGDLWSPPFVGLLADFLPMRTAMLVLPVAIAFSSWLWWPRAREADAIAENPGT